MTTLIETIQQLRRETGAGVLATRRALEQANGNYNEALSYLRDQAKSAAARRSDRPVSQGVVELYTHGQGRIGVMVEINTETDFAARSPAFRSFAHAIALQIAAAAPAYVSDADIPAGVLEQAAEKAAAGARREGKSEALIPRIVAGQLDKFKNGVVLLRQASIRDEQITVAQLLEQASAAVGEKIVIRRFARWELTGAEDDAPER